MKKVILFAAFAVVGFVSQAQDETAFTKGSSSVSVGYGFLSPYKKLFKLNSAFAPSGTTSKYSALGPIGLTYEYGVSEKIGVGVQVAYSTIKNVTTEKDGLGAGKDYIETEKLNQLSVIARGNYHFGNSAKFDPYVGLGLGYGNFKYTVEDNDAGSTPLASIAIPTSFGITGQLGAKYYFSSNVGAYAEIGYLAGSFAQVGVTFKF